MDFKRTFNSTTMYGRRNVALATLGGIASFVIYKKAAPMYTAQCSGAKSTAPPFPTIRSTHSLVAKHVTPYKWAQLGGHKTATSGFTLGQAIACAVQFDDQHCGIYAGDEDSYKDFKDVFEPIILLLDLLIAWLPNT